MFHQNHQTIWNSYQQHICRNQNQHHLRKQLLHSLNFNGIPLNLSQKQSLIHTQTSNQITKYTFPQRISFLNKPSYLNADKSLWLTFNTMNQPPSPLIFSPFSLFFWNANSLQNNNLALCLNMRNIDIALTTETHLTPNKTLFQELLHYLNCGSIAIFIYNKIKFSISLPTSK